MSTNETLLQSDGNINYNDLTDALEEVHQSMRDHHAPDDKPQLQVIDVQATEVPEPPERELTDEEKELQVTQEILNIFNPLKVLLEQVAHLSSLGEEGKLSTEQAMQLAELIGHYNQFINEVQWTSPKPIPPFDYEYYLVSKRLLWVSKSTPENTLVIEVIRVFLIKGMCLIYGRPAASAIEYFSKAPPAPAQLILAPQDLAGLDYTLESID